MSDNSLKNQSKPLVSIIIPFFNSEEFISETIESVLVQTVENWELFLIDDGSTDKTATIVQKFKEKYPDKIFFLHHEDYQNKGANAARNLGIANAKGKYITFLDSDDIFFPDTIERELKAFEENPEADAVCGTFECWFSWSDKPEIKEKDFTVDLVFETEKLHQPPYLLVHNLISGGRKPGINCVMLKNEFARTIGPFEENYRYTWEDQIIWAKLTLNGKIYAMDAVLTKYRQHLTSMSAIDSKGGEDIPSMNIYLDWLETYLRKQKVENRDVWKVLHGFRRILYLETKFKKLKQIYRRLLPLHIRYKIRDTLTRLKQIFLRSVQRSK